MSVIGIMSMQRIANYGSFLQAYALKRILEGLGHSVQFVDYRIGKPVIEDNKKLWKIGKILEILSYDAPLVHRVQFLLYKKKFAKKYNPLLSITPKPNYSPKVDILIIGSDEVFNCCQSNPKVGYSLELFGKNSRAGRLISYAASFGNTTLSKLELFKKRDEIGSLLRNFDAISVRDKNSFGIISELTGIIPEQHVDPVLAYDFTGDDKFIPSVANKEKYLLLYSYSGRMTKEENKKIREYANSKGLKIYSIGGIHRCADKFIDCSPFEVYAYFRNAEVIITDTFHGTIFSIINERPFVTIVRSSSCNNYGNEEKLTDLLERVGLTDRILNSIGNLSLNLKKKIDWKRVGSTIDAFRQESYAYLSKECVINNKCNISQVGLNCTGCGACSYVCAAKCITISDNEEGFKYPLINKSECTGCGLCLKICPEAAAISFKTPQGVYGLKNKDVARINNSASGGAADVISEYIVTNGGSVFGCAFSSDLEAMHIEVTDPEDLYKLQSSKYVQSDLGNCYYRIAERLEAGRQVLFIGTPCQVAGLYSFLTERDISKLYTIDLICHGVPSPLLFKKYIEYQKDKLKEKILYYNFRSKEKRGWGTQYLLKIQTQTKTITKILGLDKYGRHLLDGDCYRESCYRCRYACKERVGDLTIGDFWGIERVKPEFYSKAGVSILLVNTDKGQEIIDKISKNVDLFVCRLEDALIKQESLVKPVFRPITRDSIYEGINMLSGTQYFEKQSIGLALKDRIKYCIPLPVIRILKKI